MVGGKVIEVIKLNRRKVWVNCRGEGSEANNTCGVYCDPGNYTPSLIEPGDSFWWNSKYCYWRPKHYAGIHEVALRKVSYSGAPRPTWRRRLLALVRRLRGVRLEEC